MLRYYIKRFLSINSIYVLNINIPDSTIGSTSGAPESSHWESLLTTHPVSMIRFNVILIIAEVFYRAGLIEKWGRGTNRVIAHCQEAGIATPEFREVAGSTVVTLRVQVGLTSQVTPQVAALLEAARQPLSREELPRILGLRDRMHFRKAYLEPLLVAGWLEMTAPDKPRSRLQRYRITAAGQGTLQRQQESVYNSE